MRRSRFDCLPLTCLIWHVRPIIHTHPERKQSFSKNALRTGGIWKHRLCVLLWKENILKRKLFENDDFMIIIHVIFYPFNRDPTWPRRLWSFQFLPALCGRKTKILRRCVGLKQLQIKRPGAHLNLKIYRTFPCESCSHGYAWLTKQLKACLCAFSHSIDRCISVVNIPLYCVVVLFDEAV